jgi:Tfp pilus assembly protein PilX
MLSHKHNLRATSRARQQGVVLLIALIVLVAMTLAGIALVRSVDTTNIIAGNLAFKQAATHSGDTGIEAAVAWLEQNNGGVILQTDNLPNGYAATRQDPAVNQTWDNYWANVLAGRSITLATDAAGNTASYSIQRMCNATGDPVAPATGCSVSPVATVSTANSQAAGAIALQYSSQVYYRITSRVVGPRFTVSYVQAIITL